MKESDLKKQFIQEFKDKGYNIIGDQIVEYREIFTILIYLSRQARVVIETSGCGSYYIKLQDYTASYSDTSVDELIRVFNVYIKQCENFLKIKI